MTSYSLDAESFINEVKKYPEIWNLNSEGNRYKNKKQGAWAGVAKTFIPDLDTMPEPDRIEVYRKLHSKWRNIRDAYVRNLRRKGGKRGYMYAKQLSFLSTLYNPNGQLESEEESSEEDGKNLKSLMKKSRSHDNTDWNHSEDDTPSTIDNLKRRRLTTKENIEFVDTPTQNDSYHTEDEDRSYFDSLLPAVREFTLDQKLEFRSEVIQLIKNIRLRSTINIKLSPTSYD